MRFITIFKDSFQYERYAFVNFIFIAFLNHKFILQVLRITLSTYSFRARFPVVILLYSSSRPKTRVTLKTAIKQGRYAHVTTFSSSYNPSSFSCGIILDHPLYSPFIISEQIRDILRHDETLEMVNV